MVQGFAEFGAREKAGWADPGIVDAYVAKFGPVTDAVAKLLVERVATSDEPLLDLCCGQGRMTAMLCAAGAQVSALDFSPQMLARAATAAPAASLHEGDAADLPFEDASFAAVLCNFGMMHLPDQPAALKEVRRVLKPGGRFVMATWAAPEDSPAFGTVFGTIKAHADFSNAPAQPDLFAFARPEVAAEMMADAGLALSDHDKVAQAWVLSGAEELFEIFLTATVGARMLIMSQRPETIEAIRQDITAKVAKNFADGSGYRVPVPVAVLCAETA